ncbi:MAG TPA: hypothetical protein VD996_16370, partial [Chitinophagaceae bacterium]|nr:hypothetical protein [Chitinophagaceae bacterium]
GNEQYLEQRSNKGYASMQSKHPEVGLVVMGVDRETGTLYIMVKKDGTAGSLDLTGIRDYLVSKGVEDAVAWDGSDSGTLLWDSTVMVEPGAAKDELIPFGVGFRMYKKP